MKRVWALLGLTLLLGAFQNCGEVGFGGGALSANQKSQGAGDQSLIASSRAFPKGTFKITHLVKKNTCRSTSPTLACPLWADSTQEVSNLTLEIANDGAFRLNSICPKTGKVNFRREKEALYVEFIERDYSTGPPVMACPMMAADAATEEAVQQLFKMKLWLEKGVYADKSQALYDNESTYLVLSADGEKPTPITKEVFTITQMKTDALINLDASMQLTIDSNRGFTLSTLCYVAKGSIPVVGQARNGVKVVVKVATESASCAVGPYRDKALAIFKGAILEQISSTGDNYRRLVDKDGYFVILKRAQFLHGAVALN